jgi:hypothetical protein
MVRRVPRLALDGMQFDVEAVAVPVQPDLSESSFPRALSRE